MECYSIIQTDYTLSVTMIISYKPRCSLQPLRFQSVQVLNATRKLDKYIHALAVITRLPHPHFYRTRHKYINLFMLLIYTLILSLKYTRRDSDILLKIPFGQEILLYRKKVHSRRALCTLNYAYFNNLHLPLNTLLLH